MDIIVTEAYRREVREDLERKIKLMRELPIHFKGCEGVLFAMLRAYTVLGADIILPAEKKGGA